MPLWLKVSFNPVICFILVRIFKYKAHHIFCKRQRCLFLRCDQFYFLLHFHTHTSLPSVCTFCFTIRYLVMPVCYCCTFVRLSDVTVGGGVDFVKVSLFTGRVRTFIISAVRCSRTVKFFDSVTSAASTSLRRCCCLGLQ